MRERERDRARAGEGQRERKTQNLKQVPGSELSTQNPKGEQIGRASCRERVSSPV